jgi:hypothetical protein
MVSVILASVVIAGVSGSVIAVVSESGIVVVSASGIGSGVGVGLSSGVLGVGSSLGAGSSFVTGSSSLSHDESGVATVANIRRLSSHVKNLFVVMIVVVCLVEPYYLLKTEKTKKCFLNIVKKM